jgi:DNA invertase Pin-like site-specific DNA recombinase
MNDNYVGYIRVSTKTQIKGGSLTFQEDAIKKYCKAHDYKLIKIYKDKGISAYKKRPQFQAMMEHIFKQDDWKGIIVYDLTRFGRSTADLLYQINRLDDQDKEFVSIKDNIDIGNKTGRMLLGMLSVIADYERETIRERMEAGKEYARVHGTRSGKPMHRPLKEIDWDQVMRFRKFGLSWRKTAENLRPRVSTTTLIKRAREEGYYDE